MIRADENLPEPTEEEWEEMERADAAAYWQQWEEDAGDDSQPIGE